MKEQRPLGWTTIEEAKLLVDAGLDPNTADMSYNFVVCRVINGNASEDWLLQPFPPDENQPHKQLPCWSLGALIGLMPKNIVVDDEEYWLNTYIYSRKQYCIDYYYCEYEVDDTLFDCRGDNLIDAAVDMIISLLKDSYIKKQE